MTGKTLLIIGLGRIGGRLAGLAKAFGMTVIGVRRDPDAGANGADSVHRFDRLPQLLPEADFVALTCPLTAETQNIIDAGALARMKPSAVLVNAARGRCVDEAALIAALQRGEINGAALDVTVEEPLAPTSPLWDMPNSSSRRIRPARPGIMRRTSSTFLSKISSGCGAARQPFATRSFERRRRVAAQGVGVEGRNRVEPPPIARRSVFRR